MSLIHFAFSSMIQTGPLSMWNSLQELYATKLFEKNVVFFCKK